MTRMTHISRFGQRPRESLALLPACFLLTSTLCGMPAALAVEQTAIQLVDHPVPEVESLPPGTYKDLVQYGQQLSNRTFAFIGPEVKDEKMRFAGNNLACTSCHQLDATKPFAMPWRGVTAAFPQYRGREDAISTVEERVNGCMERSMNGKALPLDSLEMKAYVTYIAFLSKGIPVGSKVEGAGMVKSQMPNRRANPETGAKVYAERCAVCHGDHGEGQRHGKVGDAQGYLFPPLWGPDTFNNGAGMNRMIMATRFIKHNMPQGASFEATQLTDDEAYDVAAYMLSKPRPQKAHLDRDFPARWNKPVDSAFPPYMLGATPEQHRYGPFPPLLKKQKEMEAELRAKTTKETREVQAGTQK
ncbi:MAG: c-type cytochrome [Lautropia sp.]|nr:c-type cytochrome [Lautropia sp.]